MTDKDFYDLWAEEDRPVDDQHLALEAARLKGKRYQLDNRIYVVRGYEIFVLHSQDIQVSKPENGVRDINIKNARMIKYTEDGKRATD